MSAYKMRIVLLTVASLFAVGVGCYIAIKRPTYEAVLKKDVPPSEIASNEKESSPQSKSKGEDGPANDRLAMDQINERIWAVAKTAESQESYLIQFNLALPEVQAAEGKNEQMIIHADGTKRYYSERKTKTWRSTVLVDQQQALWKYDDPTSGVHLFRVPFKEPPKNAIVALSDGDLIHNLPIEFETSVFRATHDLFDRVTVAKHTRSGQDERAVVNTQRYGQVFVRLKPSEVQVTADSFESGKLLFSVVYRDGIQALPDDPRTSFASQFTKGAKQDIHVFESGFTMDRAFEKVIGDLSQPRLLSVKQAKEQARKMGLLFPVKNETDVQRAETAFGELSLFVRKGGSSYVISQWPAGSRFEIPKQFVVKTRKLRDYDVSEIRDPSAPESMLYYLRPNSMLIVVPPFQFSDPVLDELVLSFTLVP